MGDIELTCDAGMTNEHRKDNIETVRKESLEQVQSIVFSEIERINSVLPEDGRIEHLDQQFLIQIFDKIKYRMEKEAPRKKHKCLNCLYYEKQQQCFVTKHCPLEDDAEPKKQVQVLRQLCPKDKIGNCPYGNESGTCFGFCWQEILSEHRERKRRHEQIKEKKADG